MRHFYVGVREVGLHRGISGAGKDGGGRSSFSSSQQLGFNLCLTLALLAKVFFEERLP